MTRARRKAIRKQLVRIAGSVHRHRWFQLALVVQTESMLDGLAEMLSCYRWGDMPNVKPWTKSVRIPRSLRGRFRAERTSLL
jgi:hypothetical protein